MIFPRGYRISLASSELGGAASPAMDGVADPRKWSAKGGPTSALRRGGSVALLLELDEQRAAGDLVALRYVDGLYHRLVRGDDRCLHLHRLEHE